MTEPTHSPESIDLNESPDQLSAYHDGELDQSRCREVEQHLATCASCRERLVAYEWLRASLREDDQTAPTAVASRLAARLEVSRRTRRGEGQSLHPFNFLRHTSWVPAAATAAASVAVMFGIVVTIALFGLPFGLPGGRVIGGPTTAVAYPCDDPAQCAVAVRFTGSVDHAAIERSFTIDPPVPVSFVWEGNTLLVKPTSGLETDQHYTVHLETDSKPRVATPVVVAFVAGGPASPVAVSSPKSVTPPVARSPAAPTTPPTRVPATSTSFAVAAIAASFTPTIAATQPVTATATTASSLCQLPPTRGFASLLARESAVASRLGCARATEVAVSAAIQPFSRGRMIWLGDRREIVAIVDGGGWTSYPDTFDESEAVSPTPGDPVRGFGKVWRNQPELRAQLGSTISTERAVNAAVQVFERGQLIWVASEQSIYALYPDGTWQRYADSFASASPSPSVLANVPTISVPTTSVPTPFLTFTPTAAAPSPIASTPQASTPPTTTASCAIAPIRGFGLVYQEHLDVAKRLGCATAREVGLVLGTESFERGQLVWRSDTREILVVANDGTWRATPDTWQDGEPLDSVGAIPAGRVAPARGFGKLWRQDRDVQLSLGWALAPEQGISGAIETFSGGLMLWTNDRYVYVLFPDHTWQRFPDKFVDPAPS